MKAAFATFTDELASFPPEAVNAGCREWARTKPMWPSLAELLACVRSNMPERIRLSGQVPENFLVRIKRVGQVDALWVRRHHYLLEPAIRAHMSGSLSDERLGEAIEAARAGRELNRAN
jgi:hypothetical protein